MKPSGLLALAVLLPPMTLGAARSADPAPVHTPVRTPVGTRGAREIERELARLASPQEAERRAAERWLGANLRRADYPRAARAARGGDAEVRRRLSRALGSDERHLGLAALFLTDPDEDVSEVGRVAIEDLIIDWDSAAADPPRPARSLPPEWLDSETRRMAIDLRAGGIGTLVDRIERLAPAPATVVLDPGLDPGVYDGPAAPLAPGEPFEGVWTDLVTELARVHRVRFEVHSFRVPLRGGRPWVRFHEPGAGRGEDTVELVTDWCRGVVRDNDRPWNTACARALAATGWPAAISWFEDLWLEQAHSAAREGLLLAASRGRVAPSLADPVRLRGLLESVDRDLAARAQGAVARAETLALALASVGPLGADDRWTGVLTDGWPRLGTISRWLRLVALEGHGRGDERARRIAFDELARSGQPLLRWQALRTLASLTAGQPLPEGRDGELADPRELLRAADGRLDELTLHVAEAGIAFPAGDWYAGVREPDELVALLRWSLDAGSVERADDVFARVLASLAVEEVATRLRAWCGLARTDAVRSLLDRAHSSAQDPTTRESVERLRLRVGLLSEDGEREALDALLAAPQLSRESLVDLGALCASRSVGWRAREALVEQVAQRPALADLEPAVVEALEALGRARLEREMDVLSSRLRTAADAADHPIVDLFYRSDWPPTRLPAPLALDDLDRRTGPGGL